MDNYKTFITDSLMTYDKNNRNQKKILKNAKYLELITINNNIENDKIIFYDENDNFILEADFELISNYDPETGLWIWGWGDARSSQKWVKTITKILNYGISLESQNNFHLKLELINSRFIISDPIQIDIHLAIASTLSKIPNIYQFVVPKELVEKENIPAREKFDILKDFNKDVNIKYIFLYNIKTK